MLLLPHVNLMKWEFSVVYFKRQKSCLEDLWIINKGTDLSDVPLKDHVPARSRSLEG